MRPERRSNKARARLNAMERSRGNGTPACSRGSQSVQFKGSRSRGSGALIRICSAGELISVLSTRPRIIATVLSLEIDAFRGRRSRAGLLGNLWTLFGCGDKQEIIIVGIFCARPSPFTGLVVCGLSFLWVRWEFSHFSTVPCFFRCFSG